MVQWHNRSKQAPRGAKGNPRGAKGNIGDHYFDSSRQKPKPVENFQAARMQEARARIAGLEKSIKAISENPLMPEETQNARIAKLQMEIKRIESQNPELKKQKLLPEFAELERKKRKIIHDYNLGLIPAKKGKL